MKDQDKTQPDEKKIYENTEFQCLVAKHEAKEHLMTSSEKMKYLDIAMEKLAENFNRSVEELKHVGEVISLLKKDNLGEQKKTINSLKQRARTEREKLKDKKKYYVIKQELQQIEEEYDKVFQHIAVLPLDEMILKMTERKGKLEGEKEQIEKEMKRTKKQREEVRKEMSEKERQEAQRKLESEKQETDDPQLEPLTKH